MDWEFLNLECANVEDAVFMEFQNIWAVKHDNRDQAEEVVLIIKPLKENKTSQVIQMILVLFQSKN